MVSLPVRARGTSRSPVYQGCAPADRIVGEQRNSGGGITRGKGRGQLLRRFFDLGRGAFASDVIVEIGREFVRWRAHLRCRFSAERSTVPIIYPAHHLAVLEIDRGKDADFAAEQFRSIGEGDQRRVEIATD